MNDAPALQAEEVRKGFRRDGYDLEVLKGVSLSLARGETAGVVGVSGAGKTTLLQILGTLDRATSGKVSYAGRNVTDLSWEEMSAFRNRSVGFVFQSHNLLPEFTVLENVTLPCLIARMDPAGARGGGCLCGGGVSLRRLRAVPVRGPPRERRTDRGRGRFPRGRRRGAGGETRRSRRRPEGDGDPHRRGTGPREGPGRRQGDLPDGVFPRRDLRRRRGRGRVSPYRDRRREADRRGGANRGGQGGGGRRAGRRPFPKRRGP